MHACYGFGNKGKPPDSLRDHYVRIMHEDDAKGLGPRDERGFLIIRFSGTNHLTKPTYLRWTRPVWITLKRTPLHEQGRVITEDFDKLADVWDLGPNHAFRAEGRRLREGGEDAMAGEPDLAGRALQALKASSEEENTVLDGLEEGEIDPEF